jgi:cytochrome P450
MPNSPTDLIRLKMWLHSRSVDALKNKRHIANETPKTIFESLIKELLLSGKNSLDRLDDEPFMLYGAGSETLARIMTIALFYVTYLKPVRDRLRGELKQVIPTPTNPVTLAQLEALPYLVRYYFLFPMNSPVLFHI